MGRRKASTTETAAAPDASTVPANLADIKTKADAFRYTTGQGIESPKAISEYMLKTFGMEMSPGMVSAYKSNEKKRKGKSGRRGRPVGRPRTEPAVAIVVASTPKKGSANGVASQLEAIKGLVNDLGVEQVKQIADLFA